MIKREFQLQLNTPAFLGDADQKGVWRTPPLKALLREWWRVAVAAEVGFDSGRLKARETALFGTAADEGGGDNHQSRIRLALGHWNEGQLRQWPPGEPQVRHPEVKDREGRARNVGAELYLGYGPLEFRQGTQIKNEKGACLQAGEGNTLKLAVPQDHADEIARALTLAHWFGSVGGRSRNGWGSLAFAATGDTPALPALSPEALANTDCVRDLEACLERDWPHAIGTDQAGPLVWQSTESFADWRDAMRFLARVKIGFRTALGFTTGNNAPRVESRHVLAYPVTKHSVAVWGNQVRIANTLRFKLHVAGNGQVRAVIYHTPCQPTLPHRGIDLADTWRRVHRWLDDSATRQDAFRDMKLTRLA